MTLAAFPSSELPALSWLASLTFATGQCHVEHGRLVEKRDDFVVEGIWSGPFADGGFDRCESFFGSGMVRRPSGEIVFVPSSATVDFLYYQVNSDGLVCSNSLPFLLAALDDRLVEFSPDYSRINNSILLGIERYEQKIPTRGGEVRRLMYHNLVVAGSAVTHEPKPLPPEFISFAQYRTYLSENLGGMMQNGRDLSRKTPLRVLSTQSKGYDSTAVNSIARDYGIDLALAIDEAKERQDYFKGHRENRPSDSGADIGRHLGIQISLIDRRNFQKDPEFEYLYWSGVHNNTDMNLHQVKEYVGAGAVLLTGTLGELWYNAESTGKDMLRTVNDKLEKWDLSSLGLSEARLHLGYVHAPVPYIGARSRKSLFDLTNSEAMRPWSIGGSYDRPIPRRLAEDAGIPREAFGQKKMATVVEFLPPYLPHGAFLRKDFFRFFRQEKGYSGLFYFILAPTLNLAFQKLSRSTFRRWIRKRFASISLVERLTRTPIFGDRFKAVLYAYCVNITASSYEEKRRTVVESDKKKVCS